MNSTLQMVNNYSVVQTDEEGEMLLSVLPSKWTTPDGSGKSGDLGYWPINYKGYRLLEKAKANPEIPADIQLLKAIPCKIKRTGFAKYAEVRFTSVVGSFIFTNTSTNSGV